MSLDRPETPDTYLQMDIFPGIFERLFGDYSSSSYKTDNQPSAILSKDKVVYS